MENIIADESQQPPILHGDIALFDIRYSADIDFRAEIIRQIEISKIVSEGDLEYWKYFIHKISDIKEFYFPMKIDNYEIYLVAIGEYGFVYCYMPSDELKHFKGYYLDNYKTIEIVIERPISYPNKLEEIARANKMVLTEDNFVYGGDNNILGLIGNRLIRVTVPHE